MINTPDLSLDLSSAEKIMESGEWVVARNFHTILIFDPVQKIAYCTGGLGPKVSKEFVHKAVRDEISHLGFTLDNFVLTPFKGINEFWRPTQVKVFKGGHEMSINNKKYVII